MFTIEKEFKFEAAHSLSGLPGDHPCSRVHGHSYRVQLILEKKEVDQKIGFVRDYRELDKVKKFIEEKMDHRNLNEVFSFNPTAELLARELFHIFKRDFEELVSVGVSETAKTWAYYQDDWRG